MFEIHRETYMQFSQKLKYLMQKEDKSYPREDPG
jgi:hypothetical protein